MPSTSPQTVRLKSTLRLLIARLRMAQKKDTAVSISSRREMSVLLSQSREESARIRVENIIQTDICVEVMEILELYAELLLARAGLLDAREKDKGGSNNGTGGGEETGWTDNTGLEEAAASIIYAGPRLPREVKELDLVRRLLLERFGKEFAAKCGVDGGGGLVPRRVVDRLRVERPREDLVEAYLTEIARTYGVEWPKRRERVEEGEDGEGGPGTKEEREREMGVLEREVDDETREHDQKAAEGEGGDGDKITTTLSTPLRHKTTDLGSPFERAELSRATPPRDIPPEGARSPISVAPPAPRSDNPLPQIKLPGREDGAVEKKSVGGKIPDVDELARRFSLLKRS